VAIHVCEECGQSYDGPGVCRLEGGRLAPWGEDPLVGQTVGHYRITKLLGAGGMGRVYRAVQPNIGSRVAIKVLTTAAAQDGDLVDRFFAEARAVNLINHENLVNIIDLAHLPDGRPYIVMEYLDGAPLSTTMKTKGPQLPLGGVVKLIVEVLDALGAAHQRGIVHRDLKPDNIFVTQTGRPEVLDFGIAKLDPRLEGRSDPRTRLGAILGTPQYMSPEQARGMPIDARSDLYSLGLILYESITGVPPFVSESALELMHLHVEAAPRPPRQLRRDLPAALESAILRALAKDPAQRFGSAQEMAMALLQAAQSLPAASWVSLGSAASAMSGVGPPSARLATSSLPRHLTAATQPQKRLILILAAMIIVAAIAAVAVVLAVRR
jgi:serine/threonine protein kinase